MRNKLLGFGAALLVAATFGVIQLSVHAAPSCDKVNIVYCGLNGGSTAAQINSLQSYYDKGVDTTNPHRHYNDLQAVYNWAGASQSIINNMNTSNTKVGVLYRSDGSIKVGGRVVGTDSYMAARYSSGSGYTKITPYAWARKVSPSHNTESTYQVLVHFDSTGKADFAVAIECANAVHFTPVKPPKPPAPKPTPVAACTNVTVAKIDDHNFRFTATGSTAHGATIKSFTFRVYQGSSVIRTKSANASNNKASVTYNRDTPGSYKVIATAATSVGSKTSNACQATFSVPKPPAPKPKPTPVYACKETTATKISRTKVQFTTTHTAKNATFKSVQYVIRNANGKEIARTNSSTYTQTKAGKYSVQAYVTFSVNGKTKTVTGANCQTTFTVPAPKTPAITIQKHVNNQKDISVQVGEQFTYELQITNTGEVDLKNAVVTDTPPAGVTLLQGSVGTITNNKWTYTIPELKVNQSVSVAITAKVPKFMAGTLVNTACVDTTQISGSPDSCSHATVSVPPCEMPGKENLPANSPECTETPPATPPTTPEVPTELPHTGIGTANSIVALLGAGSLIGAVSYYIASRRALG